MTTQEQSRVALVLGIANTIITEYQNLHGTEGLTPDAKAALDAWKELYE